MVKLQQQQQLKQTIACDTYQITRTIHENSKSIEIEKMNLITNRPLDRAEKQVIYELTLKKRQSKKSTMSEKQLAAMQQLAHELMLERIIPIEDSILAHNRLLLLEEEANNNNNNNNTKTLISSSSSTNSIPTTSTTNNDDQSNSVDADQPSTSGSIDTIASTSHSNTGSTTSGCCTTTSSLATSSSVASNLNHKFNNNNYNTNLLKSKQRNPQQQQYQTNSPACSSCGCSFGRSDSSYSGSSQTSGTSSSNSCNSNSSSNCNSNCSNSDKMILIDEITRQEEQMLALKRETNIKLTKTKLDHLNEELERRLYQYEYLVTKEKALLGAYNMVLFTNEGVNNFYRQ